MKRVVWFSLGVAVAAVVIWQGSKIMRKATPQGVQDTVTETANELADKVKLFASTFTSAMAEHEEQLRTQMNFAGVESRAIVAKRAV